MADHNLKYKNVRELAKLPFFKSDAKGQPELAIEVPPIVDFHIHLGMSFFLSSPIDLKKKTRRVMHSFRDDSVPVDLSVYSGVNMKEGRRVGSWSDHIHTLVTKHGPNATYTIPNSCREMDRLGVRASVVLPIDFPVASRNSQYTIENIVHNQRFIPFCGINSQSAKWEAEMDECLELGARGIKIHPYSQFLPPNHPKVLKLLKRWSRTGLPVLFHTAHNGLEPAPLRKLSDIELYEEPLRRFPETTFIFGHGGMNYYEKAVEMAKAHGDTYLEIGGHPSQNIKHMIDLIGNDRLLFGSDWPWYPVALPLAKTLIATEDDKESRDKILSGNAYALIDRLRLQNTGGPLKPVMSA